MVTQKQIDANRSNARRSTGPRSPAGKQAVARNAIKHGIFSHLPVLPDELPEEWEAHRTSLVEAYAPTDAAELVLVDRLALLLWRLRRVTRFETAVTTSA